MPGASVTQVLGALQSTGVDILDGVLTHQRISVDAARLALVTSGAALPGAPGAPVITGSGNAISIGWAPPTTGDSPTSYTVLARLAPGGPVVAALPVGASLSTTVGAPNGAFFVTVQGANAAGSGPESAGVSFSVPFVPAVPGAPQGLLWFGRGSTVQFVTTGGIPLSYIVTASFSPGGPTIASLPAGATAVTVAAPSGTYYVRVRGLNSAGAGTLSNEISLTVP